jgi:hypothetical protein
MVPTNITILFVSLIVSACGFQALLPLHQKPRCLPTRKNQGGQPGEVSLATDRVARQQDHFFQDRSCVTALFMETNDDEKDEKSVSSSSAELEDSSFDGEGFANYLAPYALAAVGSILVTGAFVKFVLLDYY